MLVTPAAPAGRVRLTRASTLLLTAVLGFVLAGVVPDVVNAEGAAEEEDVPVGNHLWSAPKTDGFAVVGYLPEWRFGGTDW